MSRLKAVVHSQQWHRWHGSAQPAVCRLSVLSEGIRLRAALLQPSAPNQPPIYAGQNAVAAAGDEMKSEKVLFEERNGRS